MADPTTSRLLIRQKTLKKLHPTRHPIVGTTTSKGDGSGTANLSAIADSILAPSGQVEDYKYAYICIAELVGGGPAIGEVARVINTDFAGSSSSLDTAPPWSLEVQTGTDYEIHYKFHPSVINDKINEIMENIRGWVLIPYGGLLSGNNFNSEDTITDDWTVSGTTQAINTTAEFTLFGTGSLAITVGAVTDYSFQQAFVTAGSPLFASVFAFVDSANGGTTAELEIWDVTNGVQIGESANTSTFNEWVELSMSLTVPDTCKQVEFRLHGSVGTVYYDAATLIRRDQRVLDLPANEFDWPEDFDVVQYFPRGDTIVVGTSLNAYRALQYPIQKWSDAEIIRDPRGVTANRLQLVSGKGGTRRWSSFGTSGATPDWDGSAGYRGDLDISHQLFFRGRVDFDTVTTDTATIYAPEDYVVNLVYADLIEDIAQDDLYADKIEGYTSKMDKSGDIRQKIAPLARNKSDDKGRIHGTFS